MYGVVNGLGQTFYYPASTSLVSQLHSNSRATALGILLLIARGIEEREMSNER
jgi:hypothetical protein